MGILSLFPDDDEAVLTRVIADKQGGSNGNDFRAEQGRHQPQSS